MSGIYALLLVEGAKLGCLDAFIEKAEAHTSRPSATVYEGTTCAVIRLRFGSVVARSQFEQQVADHVNLPLMKFTQREERL